MIGGAADSKDARRAAPSRGTPSLPRAARPSPFVLSEARSAESKDALQLVIALAPRRPRRLARRLL